MSKQEEVRKLNKEFNETKQRIKTSEDIQEQLALNAKLKKLATKLEAMTGEQVM